MENRFIPFGSFPKNRSYDDPSADYYLFATNSSDVYDNHLRSLINDSYFPLVEDTSSPSGDLGGNFSSYLLSTPVIPASSSSYDVYQRLMEASRHWVQRVLVPLVMCVGVIGNSVSMVVLTRRKMRSSTNTYLSGLAISDLLYLVFAFSLSLQHHPDIKHLRHWLYWQYFRYGLWFTDASSSTSIWLTVTFTIERFIAISHPIKGKVLCTVSRAKKVVIMVYVMCWVLTATTPHEWVVVTRVKPSTNQEYLSLDYSRLGQDPTYRHAYYWFTAVIFILLPLFLLVIFNGFLVQSVRRSKVQRRRMTMVSERDRYSHQQEHKITVMLIAVVILALVCQMPTAILLLYSTVYEPPPLTKAFAIMRVLGNIFNLLNAVNAAANFILYSAFSDKYRRTFLITFLPCYYHPQLHPHSFATSYDGRRNTGDNASFRSYSRRLSKTPSTPSPMPLTQSPRIIRAGSFREKRDGTLDPRASLQCAKRRINLSPLDAYVKINQDTSPNYDYFTYDSAAARRSQARKDKQHLLSPEEKSGDEVSPAYSSFTSPGDSEKIRFKFNDESDNHLGQDFRLRSPPSHRKQPIFTFGDDAGVGGRHLSIMGSSCESPGSSLTALSPSSTVLSSDTSKETTILSPD